VRKRPLFYSRMDLCQAMAFTMMEIPHEKSSLEIMSRSVDPSTLSSCKALAHILLEAIAAMTRVRVQDPCPCKEKELRTFQSISRAMHDAGTESLFDGGYKQRTICLSNEIHG
jgi:hypothetical protein